jgi:release factor glutamine methyltransferase
MEIPATPEQFLKNVTDSLEKVTGDRDSARQEASLIAEHVLGVEITNILAGIASVPTKEQFSEAVRILRRREEHVPLAHILGYAWFYNHRFYVADGVLVPRPETEILVDEAITFIGENPGKELRIFDLYTGCGNVILSINLACDRVSGTGIDSDGPSIECAEKNRIHFHCDNIEFRYEDIFAFIENTTEKYHLITANPPYIRSGEISSLQPEISQYENRAALDGGPDGMDHYRQLAGKLWNVLEPDGLFLSEIGIGQKDEISDLFGALVGVQSIKDLNGIPRVISARI